MRFEEVDRAPFSPGGPYREALNRWYGEGLPWGTSITEYFDFDESERIPIDFGPIHRFVTRILQEDDRSIVTGFRSTR